MKIVLSRKGFDSSAGGYPSPIFPDGRMVSLPIPSSGHSRRLCDLTFDATNLGDLAADLSAGRVARDQTIHLDPDIIAPLIQREDRWSPAFGQAGSAESHLRNQQVGIGDLFLFYGWFRRIEVRSGHYQYASNSPDVHVVFGWLQIDEVWDLTSQRQALLAAHPEQASHPHVANPTHFKSSNTLYIASERLVLPEKLAHRLAGAGYLPQYNDRLRLTAPGRSRSIWQLPSWFFPRDNKLALSYHGNAKRWSQGIGCVELCTVGRGQEFVLDADTYPEAIPWLTAMLTGLSQLTRASTDT